MEDDMLTKDKVEAQQLNTYNFFSSHVITLRRNTAKKL